MSRGLAIGLLVSASFVAGAAVEHFRAHHDAWADWQARYIAARTELLRAPAPQADLAMLGDSLTEYEPDWAALLGQKAANLGIAGDTAAHALTRIDAVISRGPKVVAVMLGINDILAGKPPQPVAADIERIATKLIAASITPIIQSTLLTAPSHRTPAANDAVHKLDATLQAWCAAHRIEFLDINSVLSDGGALAERFTWDGLHLNSAGYRGWGEMLRADVHHQPP